jgi:transposase
MKDTDLYAQILSIEDPWFVSSVQFDKPNGKMTVSVELKKKGLRCPTCSKISKKHDSRVRQWRHLDTCQFSTFIEAEIPRVSCEEHGVHQVNIPWAEANSRFTLLFERLVIDLLQDCSLSVVSKHTNLTWDQVDGIQSRAVERGLKRKKKHQLVGIGIDEVAYKKGHNYFTIVHDKTTGEVLHVVDGRKTEDIDTFYKDWSGYTDGITSISMDLWKAFIKSTRNNISNADEKICFDRFHVAGFFSKAVDKVRKLEHQELLSIGDKTLSKSKYSWLRNASKLDGRSRKHFMALTKLNLKTARAWAIKETAGKLWDYTNKTWAVKMWKKLIGWMWRSKLKPIVELSKSIRKHFFGILNSVILGVNNGRAESINAKIQKIKKMSCGFRNVERFKKSILFHMGNLDLYPN